MNMIRSVHGRKGRSKNAEGRRAARLFDGEEDPAKTCFLRNEPKTNPLLGHRDGNVPPTFTPERNSGRARARSRRDGKRKQLTAEIVAANNGGVSVAPETSLVRLASLGLLWKYDVQRLAASAPSNSARQVQDDNFGRGAKKGRERMAVQAVKTCAHRLRQHRVAGGLYLDEIAPMVCS